MYCKIYFKWIWCFKNWFYWGVCWSELVGWIYFYKKWFYCNTM